MDVPFQSYGRPQFALRKLSIGTETMRTSMNQTYNSNYAAESGGLWLSASGMSESDIKCLRSSCSGFPYHIAPHV